MDQGRTLIGRPDPGAASAALATAAGLSSVQLQQYVSQYADIFPAVAIPGEVVFSWESVAMLRLIHEETTLGHDAAQIRARLHALREIGSTAQLELAASLASLASIVAPAVQAGVQAAMEPTFSLLARQLERLADRLDALDRGGAQAESSSEAAMEPSMETRLEPTAEPLVASVTPPVTGLGAAPAAAVAEAVAISAAALVAPAAVEATPVSLATEPAEVVEMAETAAEEAGEFIFDEPEELQDSVAAETAELPDFSEQPELVDMQEAPELPVGAEPAAMFDASDTDALPELPELEDLPELPALSDDALFDTLEEAEALGDAAATFDWVDSADTPVALDSLEGLGVDETAELEDQGAPEGETGRTILLDSGMLLSEFTAETEAAAGDGEVAEDAGASGAMPAAQILDDLQDLSDAGALDPTHAGRTLDEPVFELDDISSSRDSDAGDTEGGALSGLEAEATFDVRDMPESPEELEDTLAAELAVLDEALDSLEAPSLPEVLETLSELTAEPTAATPEEQGQALPEELPEEWVEELPEKFPEELPEELTEELPDDLADALSEAMPEEPAAPAKAAENEVAVEFEAPAELEQAVDVPAGPDQASAEEQIEETYLVVEEELAPGQLAQDEEEAMLLEDQALDAAAAEGVAGEDVAWDQPLDLGELGETQSDLGSTAGDMDATTVFHGEISELFPDLDDAMDMEPLPETAVAAPESVDAPATEVVPDEPQPETAQDAGAVESTPEVASASASELRSERVAGVEPAASATVEDEPWEFIVPGDAGLPLDEMVTTGGVISGEGTADMERDGGIALGAVAVAETVGESWSVELPSMDAANTAEPWTFDLPPLDDAPSQVPGGEADRAGNGMAETFNAAETARELPPPGVRSLGPEGLALTGTGLDAGVLGVGASMATVIATSLSGEPAAEVAEQPAGGETTEVAPPADAGQDAASATGEGKAVIVLDGAEEPEAERTVIEFNEYNEPLQPPRTPKETRRVIWYMHKRGCQATQIADYLSLERVPSFSGRASWDVRDVNTVVKKIAARLELRRQQQQQQASNALNELIG